MVWSMDSSRPELGHEEATVKEVVECPYKIILDREGAPSGAPCLGR